jgi:hypothetical protein
MSMILIAIVYFASVVLSYFIGKAAFTAGGEKWVRDGS